MDEHAEGLERMKQKVTNILHDHPEGLTKNYVLDKLQKFIRYSPASNYGVTKLKHVFKLWDNIEEFKCPKTKEKMLRLKQTHAAPAGNHQNPSQHSDGARPKSYSAIGTRFGNQGAGSIVEGLINSPHSFSLDFLKKDILYALNSNPDGVKKNDVWKVVRNLTGRQVNPLEYGFTTLDELLALWNSELEEFGGDNGVIMLRVRGKKGIDSGHNGPGPGTSTMMSSNPGATISGQAKPTAIECMKLAGNNPLPVNNSEQSSDANVGGINRLTPEVVEDARSFLRTLFNEQSSWQYNSVRARVKTYVKHGRKMKLKGKVMDFLLENMLGDMLLFDELEGIRFVSLNPKYVSKQVRAPGPSAMDLMQQVKSAQGNPTQRQSSDQFIDLTATPGRSGRQAVGNNSPVVIDLTDPEADSRSVSSMSPSLPLLGPAPQQAFGMGTIAGIGPRLGGISPQLQNFFQGAVPQAHRQGIMGAAPIPSLLGPALSFTNPQNQNQANQAPSSQINFLGPSNIAQTPSTSMSGQRDFVEDLVVKPVDLREFEHKELIVRRVYLARNEKPDQQYVDNIAKECIELLADANEYVSQDRVQKLILQRFNFGHINMLGVRYIDNIPCVNELNRLLCKVNAYIIAFVRTRSICTLHELKESLREYVPNRGEFRELKLGPLQRFPVVFQNFKFPPNKCEIPEITSMDVLDHFRNYLTKFSLWSKRLELEPFMNYLVEIYNVPDAYILGVRVRSLPLAAAVLKKAGRDSGASRREILEHFKDKLKTEIEDAFRKFRASILQSEGEGMEVRRHYLKMRPELAIPEIFEKFTLLMELAEMTDSREKKLAKVINEFSRHVCSDPLVRNLLHLSICMSNTALEELALSVVAKHEVITIDDDNDETQDVKTTSAKTPPAKDDLVQSLTMYMERCLHSGSFSLPLLSKIEENLICNYGYSAFSQMGYGRFLEFLLMEAKQLLDEAGGVTLGSGGSSGGDTEGAGRPHLRDIFDFIKQCQQAGLSQSSEIEAALCRHYSVKEARNLGYGHMSRLMARLQKMNERRSHQLSDHVFYEAAVAPSKSIAGGEMKVGVLGHQTTDLAKICLHNCPLLEDLAEWSQWGLVFEPELGKLKDFIDRHGGESNKHLEGGRLATLDFLALETAPGRLLKVVSNTSPDHFAEALGARDYVAVSGHLVSMVVSFKGVANMPLALLTSHMKTNLLQMHASDAEQSVPGAPVAAPPKNIACQFVLRALLCVPTQICVALANQVFLEPLGQVVGSTTSKQLLISMCSSVQDLNRMIELGCKLGVNEWSAMMSQQKCRLPESAIQVLPPDVEEFFDTPNQQQEEDDDDDESEDSDDDVDEILAGDVDTEECLKIGRLKLTSAEKQQKKGETMQAGTDRASKGGKDGDKQEDKGTTDKTNKAAPTDTDDVNTDGQKEKEDEEGDVVMEEVDKLQPSQQRCEEIVNQIRKEEFGIGVKLGEDGERLMKVQQARLGRSLDRLSKDLYSKDTHFVLELVQNADDNNYSADLLQGVGGVCPSVKFIMDSEGITVLNNEQGFEEINIRALCDVGRSTKGKHKFGYIGQKGIGFKSVFRVTDAPEVHSNGFHIQFDVNSGPMGYILPHWVEPVEDPSNSQWMTKIILRLKPDILRQTRTLASRFNDIHPALLLFLHRLREITIENKVEQNVQSMRRRDIGERVVEITHTDGRTERWLVIKHMLDASKVSSQAKSGVDVESTEVAMAFPIHPAGQNCQAHVLPAKQPVFAFLPLRSYGFRFIIQGDFDVPSSREDVDRDSPWNQWLRSEIHTLFLEALEVFKNHEEFSSIEAVCAFLQFVPMEDEILDFFKPVATDILKKLRAKPCVPTQPNDQGVISWKLPSQTVRVRDPVVRSVVTPDLLQKHLNLSYLHPDVVALLNPTLTSCLGIETLTTDHLYQLGSALLVNMGPKCKTEDVVLIAKWLACMYRNLDDYRENDAILSSLKALRMLPLSDGQLISLEEMVVFFPITKTASGSKDHRDPLLRLQQDVSSLHPLLVNTDDPEVNSQVHKLLLRLDVKPLSPSDVINSHIIPVLKSDQWKKKSDETLMSYLVYIKEQTDRQPTLCNLEELKGVVQVITTEGRRNPTNSLIHFPTCYGNPTDLHKQFPGYPWTLLSSKYLPISCTAHQVNGWHSFFSRLGVEDFLSVKQRDVMMTREALATSVWRSASELLPQTEEDFTIQDWHSAELEALIKNNLLPDGQVYQHQMRLLLEYLDKNWDSRFTRYKMAQVIDKQKKPLKDVPSSLALLLKTHSWVPSLKCKNVYNEGTGTIHVEKEIVLQEPADVYIHSVVVENILAHNVLYLDVPVTTGTFTSFLGLKRSLKVAAVKDLLIEWSKQDESTKSPVRFCTSLKHMKHVYRYLRESLTRQQSQILLREHPVIFVPDRNQTGLGVPDMVVAGHFLNRSEVWMADRTRLFDKHYSLLKEFHSDICKKRTIKEYYVDSPDIMELFTQEGNITAQPELQEYLELLELLCSTSTPKEARILSDVLYILSLIGQIVTTPPEGMPSEDTAQMVLNTHKSLVQNKFKKLKVLPTKRQMWVSLDDQPIIADHKNYEKLFEKESNVHFLDLEDKASHKPARSVGYRGQRSPWQGDSRVDPKMISSLLEVLEIPFLSTSVGVMPIPSVLEPCPQLQGFLHEIVPTMQQFMLANFQDTYEELKQLNFREMLTEAKFYQTSELEVRYTLEALKEDTYVIHQEKCVIQPPTFFFHLDHLTSSLDINSEIARSFSNNDSLCSMQLRSFLMELSNIVYGTTSNTLEDLLRQHDANTVTIPTEEKWYVPPPPAPVKESPKTPEPPQEVESTMGVPFQGQRFQGQGNEGSQEMRAWPPVARDNNRPPVKRDDSDRPASNIWPPPQGKDYMRSVRDLPAGVRVLDPEDDRTQGTSEQKQGYAGQGTSRQEGGQGPGTNVTGEVTRKRKLSGDPNDNSVKRYSGDLSVTVIEENPSDKGQGQNEVRGQTDSGRSEDQSRSRDASRHSDERHGVTDQRSDNSQQNTGEGQRSQEGERSQSRDRSTEGRPAEIMENNQSANIKGNPIWSQMATDYTYDELAQGHDLHLPDTLPLSEGSSDTAIGAWGEGLVAAYLQQQKDAGNILEFYWTNIQEETGRPFDFEVRYRDQTGVHTDYIEVKSTVSSDKAVFEISVHQIKFATEMKGNFHIYRVFNAGDPERVKLIRIHDLDSLLSTKQVKLCMLI